MRIHSRVSLILVAIMLGLSAAATSRAQSSERVVKAQGYVSTDQIKPGDKFKIAITVQVQDGYHINAHVPTLDYLVATAVTFDPVAGVTFKDPQYPAPVRKAFDFSPDTALAVHEGTITILADAEADKTLKPGPATIVAKLDVQSCNNSQCLAPARLNVEIPVKIAAATAKSAAANADVFARAAAQEFGPGSAAGPTALTTFEGGDSPQNNQIAGLISKYGLGVALIFVFLFGLALNATPCVYPIIPITIGFFANQGTAGQKTKLSKTLSMATCYVLGMAITYSILGVVASLSGGLFGGALQKPPVLIGMAVLMLALSLSMFGVYEFRLPESFNRFANSSMQSTSGLLGALVMGLTMGIVAAPCIGPFVSALVVHVGVKHDPFYGFLLFFVLALGLGTPYLVLGTFSGAIKSLPRSGMWMITVRKVFGVVMVGMAIYFVMPLLGRFVTPVLVAYFAIAAAYLLFWESGRTKPAQFAWVLRCLGVGAAVAAVMMAIPKKIEAGIEWQPYSEAAVAEAKKAGKGVIIDTFADWCIPCKELDSQTFIDPEVRRDAERFVALKLDLTHSGLDTENGRAAGRFDIRGVPTVLFLDRTGNEAKDARLQGFEKPQAFLARMKKVDAGSSAGSSASGAATESAAAEGPKGTPMPAATVKTLDGTALSLQSMQGKVVLIDFWATWCVPCMSEIPTFNDLNRDYKSLGLEMMAVALDEEGMEKVKPFVQAHPMKYNVAVGDKAVGSAFGVGEVLPVAILADRHGRIRYTHTGITDKAKFESEIKELLSEQ